jgi:hypothetical protein
MQVKQAVASDRNLPIFEKNSQALSCKNKITLQFSAIAIKPPTVYQKK